MTRTTRLARRFGAARLVAALCGLVMAVAASACVAAGTTSASTAAGKADARAAHGKPGSGVLVRATVPARIAVGETVAIRLQVSGVTAADGASIEVRDVATQLTLLSARLAAGEARTIELPYTGRSDGMQTLAVTTTQAGRASVQAVALPVGSGQVHSKPQGQRRTTASGEAVISLPASSPGSTR